MFQIHVASQNIFYFTRTRRTQNVGHLVLEVLRCNQRVEELPTPLNHSVNFTTASSQMRVVVEGLPEVVDRLASGLGTGINKNTDFGLDKTYQLLPPCAKSYAEIPTSSILPIALNNQRWELIFFWFFALRTKMMDTGTRLLGSSP